MSRLSELIARAEGTRMYAEAAEASTAVRRQLVRNKDAVAHLAAKLRCAPPRAILTLGRGSSDNAATFGRYLFETQGGVLTSSIAPSIGAVYDAMPDMRETVMLALSQSGRSPDLLRTAKAAKARGTYLVALVNDEESPLAQNADLVIPLCAGPEISVAATKSFITALSAQFHILTAWRGTDRMKDALAALPDFIDSAWALDWSSAVQMFRYHTSVYVVGRGHGLGIAQEIALKMKETSGLHAEAFSAAEVRHGPMTLVQEGFPVLLTAQNDESLLSVEKLADEFAGRSASLITAGFPLYAPGMTLPTIDADPIIQPILLATTFYRFANLLAVARGRDPDRPPSLAKVTETI